MEKRDVLYDMKTLPPTGGSVRRNPGDKSIKSKVDVIILIIF